MGYAYIVTFQADEIDLIESKVTHKQLVEEVGVAVVNLCVNPAYYGRLVGSKRLTTLPLGHTANGVSYCGEVHSGDREVYSWIGNKLSTIHELDDEYFVEIFKVIEQ